MLPNDLGFLRIREGPSTATTELGTIPLGETVSYDDVQNNWYHVVYEEVLGWISGTYVEVSE